MAKIPKSPIQFDLQLTTEQKKAKEKILQHPYNFVIGSEGTGKTLLAMQIALDGFFRCEYTQIVITRPAVAVESLGFLPGDIDEKMGPFLRPIFQNLNMVYGSTEAKKNKIKKHIEQKDIEIIPVAYTRGITYVDSIVVCDEFQNLEGGQLELLLGRLGKNSKLILTGSKSQIDLPRRHESAIHLLSKLEENEYVSITELKSNHRHPAVESVLNDIRK